MRNRGETGLVAKFPLHGLFVSATIGLVFYDTTKSPMACIFEHKVEGKARIYPVDEMGLIDVKYGSR